MCVERGRWVEGESRVAEVISAGELFGGFFMYFAVPVGTLRKWTFCPFSQNLPICQSNQGAMVEIFYLSR